MSKSSALEKLLTFRLSADAKIATLESERNALAEEVKRLTEERDGLRAALKSMISAYVRLMECGRDRIIDLGGSCDPVDVMEAGDPNLRSARAAIAIAEPKKVTP